jgi:hypothetical protein
VHEEFLSRERISEHRDFVLSLEPTLVYLVSQLWISFEKRDGEQWKYFLCMLAENNKVGTKDLEDAAVLWKHIVSTAPRAGWPASSVAAFTTGNPPYSIPPYSALVHAPRGGWLLPRPRAHE